MSEYLDRLADGRDAIIEAVRAQDGVAGIRAFAAYERIVEEEVRSATTDEPGLRAAIRAAWDRAASNTSAGDCIELEDLLAASSAASDGSLDAERLARALKPGHDFVHDGGLDDCQFADDDAAIEAATRIAAEYERLNQ